MKYATLFLLGFLFGCSPKVLPGQCYNNAVKVTSVYTDSSGNETVEYNELYNGLVIEQIKNLNNFKTYFSISSCFDYEIQLRLQIAEQSIDLLKNHLSYLKTDIYELYKQKRKK